MYMPFGVREPVYDTLRCGAGPVTQWVVQAQADDGPNFIEHGVPWDRAEWRKV
jgi:hypothetical protein